MLSERDFVRSYASFWKDTLPFSEMYVRHLNASDAGAYASDLVSGVAAKRRALVNELAFEIYAAAPTEKGVAEVVQSRERISELYASAIERARKFADFGLPQGPLTFQEQAEAIKLAKRTAQYFARFSDVPCIRPSFPGCGSLSAAEGDLFVENTLFEIKAGERGFRGIDLRQLLTYCALNDTARRYDVQQIGLVNPRTGTYFREHLGVLCVRLSGEPMEAVLGRIRGFLSRTLASP